MFYSKNKENLLKLIIYVDEIEAVLKIRVKYTQNKTLTYIVNKSLDMTFRPLVYDKVII